MNLDQRSVEETKRTYRGIKTTQEFAIHLFGGLVIGGDDHIDLVNVLFDRHPDRFSILLQPFR